jgi:hypothetical protein
MFGRTKSGLSTRRDDYKANIGEVVSNAYTYNVQDHTQKAINVTAKEDISINSGWIREEQNEVFKQIILSKLVWIDDKPVFIKSNGIEYKESKYDKLINYNLSFEYAYNEINNIS